jgi:hypothetical protein
MGLGSAMTGTPRLLTETPAGAALIDEALRMIHLSSAVFLRGEFTAPWALLSLGPDEYAATLCPGAERLILFHVVLEGGFTVRMETGEEASLGPGEAVVVPYCDQHTMGHPGLSRPVRFGRARARSCRSCCSSSACASTSPGSRPSAPGGLPPCAIRSSDAR